MKVTIAVIAEIAGVSRGAVDKVIHGRPGVDKAVRKRVQQVIDQTGYVPLHSKKQVVQSEKKTMAVVLPQLDNSFYAALQRGIENTNTMIPESNIKIEYYHYVEMDFASVLTILDFLEDRKIDACVIRGVRSHLLCEKLNRLSDRGTAVVFIDSDVPEAKRLCFVSEDCYRSGRIAASLLAKSIGFQGAVCLIGGNAAATSQRLRTKGFEDAIRERWPDITLVERIYTQDQSVIAYEKACALLDHYPGLRGIYAIAGCAGEIGQAILDRGRAEKVRMICYNMTQSVAALIRKGIVQFSISISPYQQGVKVFQLVYDYLTCGKMPEKFFLKMPIEIALDENLDLCPEDCL